MNKLNLSEMTTSELRDYLLINNKIVSVKKGIVNDTFKEKCQ